MSNTEQSTPTQNDGWPRKLNRVLIGIGVLAFGLIIADRLVSVFQADDLPKIAAPSNVNDTPQPALVAGVENESVAVTESIASAETTLTKNPEKSVLDLEDVFGSQVVFVSASEPMFVVTEDEKRYDVGSEVTSEYEFAGATQQQIILKNNGDLIVIGLPDPSVQ